jgi:hypothetical protein
MGCLLCLGQFLVQMTPYPCTMSHRERMYTIPHKWYIWRCLVQGRSAMKSTKPGNSTKERAEMEEAQLPIVTCVSFGKAGLWSATSVTGTQTISALRAGHPVLGARLVSRSM